MSQHDEKNAGPANQITIVNNLSINYLKPVSVVRKVTVSRIVRTRENDQFLLLTPLGFSPKIADTSTGQARLIRSHLLARVSFKLSGNSN